MLIEIDELWYATLWFEAFGDLSRSFDLLLPERSFASGSVEELKFICLDFDPAFAGVRRVSTGLLEYGLLKRGLFEPDLSGETLL